MARLIVARGKGGAEVVLVGAADRGVTLGRDLLRQVVVVVVGAAGNPELPEGVHVVAAAAGDIQPLPLCESSHQPTTSVVGVFDDRMFHDRQALNALCTFAGAGVVVESHALLLLNVRSHFRCLVHDQAKQ
jgi:hypothetical protein